MLLAFAAGVVWGHVHLRVLHSVQGFSAALDVALLQERTSVRVSWTSKPVQLQIREGARDPLTGVVMCSKLPSCMFQVTLRVR